MAAEARGGRGWLTDAQLRLLQREAPEIPGDIAAQLFREAQREPLSGCDAVQLAAAMAISESTSTTATSAQAASQSCRSRPDSAAVQ